MLSGVTAGGTYQFRLRAWNKWGVGGPSAVLNIEASTIPGEVSTATTTISGSHVRVSWSAPEAHGNAIIAYTILLRELGGGYTEELGHCDGTSPTVLAELACEIPISILRGAPFTLAYADLVVARVSAHNGVGEGPVSPSNAAGAHI